MARPPPRNWEIRRKRSTARLKLATVRAVQGGSEMARAETRQRELHVVRCMQCTTSADDIGIPVNGRFTPSQSGVAACLACHTPRLFRALSVRAFRPRVRFTCRAIAAHAVHSCWLVTPRKEDTTCYQKVRIQWLNSARRGSLAAVGDALFPPSQLGATRASRLTSATPESM